MPTSSFLYGYRWHIRADTAYNTVYTQCSRLAVSDVNGACEDVKARTATHCLCHPLRCVTFADCQLQRSCAAFPLLTVKVSTTHCSQSTEPASHDQLLLLTAGTCERCCCLRPSPQHLQSKPNAAGQPRDARLAPNRCAG
jgi:hypothetical protein